MKGLLIISLIVAIAAANPIENWVNAQQEVAAGNPVVQKMRSSVAELESASFLLRQEDLPQEDVVATIKTILPIADGKIDSEHFDVFEKMDTASFEWFSYNDQVVSYTWLVTTKQQNGKYTLDIVSGSAPEIQLSGGKITVMRVAFPSAEGHFDNDALPVFECSLSENDAMQLLDVVKLAAARVMLGHSSPHKKALNAHVKGNKRIIPQIMAVTSAIDAITSTWKGIVSAFGSSTTQTIQRVVGLGFEKYNQKSRLLKAFGVPKKDVSRFSKAVLTAMGIGNDPQTQAVMTAMEFTTTFTWVEDAFTYTEKAANNHATTLMVYKFGDANSDMADFMYVKIESDFGLADDLLYVTTSKSKLGGLFSSTKTKIERIPHILSLNDAQLLQTFFKVIAIGKLAEDLGVQFEWPDLPQGGFGTR